MSRQLFIAYRDSYGWLNVTADGKLNCYSDYAGSASEASAVDWKAFMERNSREFELAPIHFLRVPFCSLREAMEEPKSAWQTMENAPKDGTRILLMWRTCKEGCTGRWIEGQFVSGWKCDEDQVIPSNQTDCILWHPIPAL